MRYEILQWIWKDIEGSPYMGTIDRDKGGAFHETMIEPGMELLRQETPGQDLFFTPLGFYGRRTNRMASVGTTLFADLDHKNFDLLHQFWPHLLWQTGPETTQAIWKLSAAPSSYDAWADLNQRMTYFTRADKGGWHGSKFLRVPETINYKYDPPHEGRVLSWQPEAAPYGLEIAEALPAIRAREVEDLPMPPRLEPAEWREYVRAQWPTLSLGSRAGLMETTPRDRSRFMLGVVNKLLAEGHSKDVVFQLVWGTAYNKFRVDRYRPDLLWKMVCHEPA